MNTIFTVGATSGNGIGSMCIQTCDLSHPKETCHDYCPCTPDAWMWCTIAYIKMIKARYPSPYY